MTQQTRMTGPTGKRAARTAGAFALAALAVAAFWAWHLRPDSVMEVTVRLSTEGGATSVHHASARFTRDRPGRPVVSLDVDLSEWKDELVRLDVRGVLRARDGSGGRLGFLGCCAELRTSAGERPLTFAQWRNRDPERPHFGRLGPASFRGPERRGRAFAYAPDGHLWHIISPSEGDSLRMHFTPVLAEDLQMRREPVVPRAPEPWIPPQRADAGRPDVFIYLIDALRADHVGCYGYPRPTTPSIDSFARGAVVYEQAHTVTPWTRPSVASLMTGLYPLAHGVTDTESSKLDTWPVTIAEALLADGYRTQHMTSAVQSSEHFGFRQGITDYAYEDGCPSRLLNERINALLEEVDPEQPVFMYVHTLDVHAPYTPLPEQRRLFDRGLRGRHDGSIEAFSRAGLLHPNLSSEEMQHLIDLYDAVVCKNDTAFGGFLRVLARLGRLDNSLIIVLADHGEAFGEHDTLSHGFTLNVEDMHIPLIIRYPQEWRAGVRVEDRVSLVDVYPTIMSAAGAAPALSYGLPGRDLAALTDGSRPVPPVPIFAEVCQKKRGIDLVGVIDEEGYKRVFDMSPTPGACSPSASIGLWDTNRDPQEQTDLRQTRPLRADYHEVLMAQYLATQQGWRGAAGEGPGASAPLTDDVRKKLEALGYLR